MADEHQREDLEIELEELVARQEREQGGVDRHGVKGRASLEPRSHRRWR